MLLYVYQCEQIEEMKRQSRWMENKLIAISKFRNAEWLEQGI